MCLAGPELPISFLSEGKGMVAELCLPRLAKILGPAQGGACGIQINTVKEKEKDSLFQRGILLTKGID